MSRLVAGMAGLVLLAGGARGAAEPLVEVIDRSFDTAANMLAYTEFELSGEPLAERLGLDLDALDPDQLDQPTAFDYAAGIESYEYSEEAMYALDFQSRLGIHLVNGPANAARGGSLESLGKRFLELVGAAGFAADELPQNLYPLSVPYRAGSPEFAGPVDARAVSRDTVQLRRAGAETGPVAVQTPAYLRDFKTLAWQASDAPALAPGAIAGALLKETMWDQDFLGGMHTRADDFEVEATRATLDQDGEHALGVSSVDGANGLILTELAWDKLWLLQERLAYDGSALGAKFGPDYDPARKPVWFPEEIRVTPAQRHAVSALGELQVTRKGSSLRDTWLLLWSTSEFFAFSDGRAANKSRNPAFQAVFDGAPFPKAAAGGRDPFSLADNVSGLLFKNLEKLHFDPELGSLVDRWNGERARAITTYDAAYAIVALAVFQRAVDALPVGYAAGDAGAKGLATPEGKRALALLGRQARFITDKLVAENGRVADAYTAGSGASSAASLDTQFAAIRGLAAAFVATGDTHFRDTARRIYRAVERERYDPAVGTYASAPGEPSEHTPWTAGAVSGGLRALMLNLANADAETTPELALAHLTRRYTEWFRIVINGGSPRTGSGMQLAEWIGDSGEYVALATGGVDAAPADTDGDGVPQITAAGGAHGTAMTLAARVRVSAGASQ